MKFFFVIILFISSVNAISLDSFECPNSVLAGEDFYCTLNISDVNEYFDVKLQIQGINSTINKVWNNNWQRSDWYINNLVDKSGSYKIKTIINDYVGDANILMRIRQSGTSGYVVEEKKEIRIILKENIKEEDIQKDKDEKIDNTRKVINKTKEEIIQKNQTFTSKTIIKLNSNNISEEIVYESKTYKVKNSLFYILIVFFVSILLFQLIRHGKCNNDYRNAWET